MSNYWLMLAFLLVFACKQVPVAEVRLATENELTTAEVDQTLKVIKARLSTAEIRWDAVHYLEDEAQFSILLLADYERDQLEDILSEKIEIGFWPTYWITDNVISDFLLKLTPEQLSTPPFTGLEINDTQPFRKEIFAYSKDGVPPVEGSEVALQDVFPDHVLPAWIATGEATMNPDSLAYPLFLLETRNGNDSPVLDQSHIVDADITISEWSPDPQLMITFSEEGAKLFQQLTTIAANNGNRAIAITLNGRVLSAPRVNEPITGGKASITGAFSMVELDKMAAILRGGDLPQALTWVSVKEVKE